MGTPRKPRNRRSYHPKKPAQQETLFASPFGNVELHRYPQENDATLKAWSASDELLLSFFNEEVAPALPDNANMLIANDTFGALSICLGKYLPDVWSDSFICQQALLKNLHNNKAQLTAEQTNKITFIPSTEPLTKKYDAILLQLPKNHSYLQFQLEQLKPHLKANAFVIAGVMVKHFHPNALQYFEQAIGDTHTSLAKKKARLIIARHTASSSIHPKPIETHATQYPLACSNINLYTLPNVFSREKLDIGTRALLPHIPSNPRLNTILDLGCGNGALGLQAATNNPNAKIIFCDESYLAIASAQLSFENSGLKNTCDFITSDTLQNAPRDIDLIVCNPPFHQQNSVHTEIAYRMFRSAKTHLNKQGKLLIVANRHLNYQGALKRLFEHVQCVDQNNKFVILSASN